MVKGNTQRRSALNGGVTSSGTAATHSAVGLRSERGPVLLAVMLCVGLVAIEATIIATAVPSIVADLGGFSSFPWLFSIFLLAQAVSVPIYGKLSDSFGRRPIMFVGIGLFLLGSVLCGAAWSMPVLIAARAIQGLGAGAIFPMSMTIVGDLYSVEERSRVQGYVASVWGISSVVGPTLGGVFAQYLSWRWIFFVNIPLGFVAVVMLLRSLHEQVEPRRHRIDYAGATLLVVGFSLLILALLEGGSAWAWTSLTGVSIVLTGMLLLIAFVLVERRAAEPVLPLWVFRRRVLVGASAVSFSVGALLIGLTSYVPTYAQGVLGADALTAGFALAAMTMGWPIAASLAGRLYMRIGFRNTCLVGTVFLLAGAAGLLTLSAGSQVEEVAAHSFLIGLGLGLTSSPSLVAVQSVVEWERRGVVTGTNMFARSIGSALGIAVFGAIANATLTRRFAEPPDGLTGDLPSSADDAVLVLDGGNAGGGALEAFVRSGLADAAQHVFIGVAGLAVLTVGAVLLMPRRTEPLNVD
ncbi:MAG: MFS transporter [Nocardioidaceae bacterium]|jgi:EmrB/QacA subfamily drug resistance transporter|nr:MFS transporter [Nocardioidaceae bacterium]